MKKNKYQSRETTNPLKKTAILYAILAAVFYALNAPISKLLLDSVPATFAAIHEGYCVCTGKEIA